MKAKLSMKSRMVLNSWPSFLYLPSAGRTRRHYHIFVLLLFEFEVPPHTVVQT